MNLGEEEWRKSEEKIIRYEEEYRNLHQIILNGGDRFIINLDNDESDAEIEDPWLN